MTLDRLAPPAELLEDLDVETDLAWIWAPDADRIVWATAAAARYWQASSAAALTAREIAPNEPLATEMRRLWRALGSQTSREAAAEFVPRGAIEAWICRIARLGVAGRPMLLVRALAPDPAATAARWREVFRATPGALAIFDADGGLIEENAAAQRLFPEDAGARIEARFADPDAARRALRLALVHGAYAQTTKLRLRAGAEERRLKLTRIAAPEDGAPALLALALDRDSIETAAPETATLFDAAAFGLAILERRAGGLALVRANRAARALLAPASDLPIEADLSASLPPRIGEALERAVADLAAQSDAEPRESVSVDLPYAPPAAEGAPPPPGPWLRGVVGRLGPDQFTLSLVDLGPERRTMLQLKIAGEQTAAALDALGVGLVSLDPSGRIREINAAGAALVGAPEDALRGVAFRDCLPRADARRFDDYVTQGPVVAGRSLEAGVDTAAHPPAGEGEAALDGGRPIRLAVAPSTRLSPGRRRVAFHARPDAATQTRAPAPAAEVESGLDADLAHSLRTRLTSVRGFAELVQDDAAATLTPLAAAYIGDILAAAAEAEALIDRHLAAPRAPRGARDRGDAPTE